MKNELQIEPEGALVEIVPLADVPAWEELYHRIRILALRRSISLTDEAIIRDEEFDRGARTLRTLMGAAEIARRIKRQEEKDKASHEETRKPPAFTDEEISELYRTVAAQVDRAEREERAHQAGDDKAHSRDCGAIGGGEVLGEPRS